MLRNMVLLVAAFLAFTFGSYTHEAIATTEASKVVSDAGPASTGTGVVAVDPTATALGIDAATPTTDVESESAWVNIKNGLWLVFMGLVALVTVWWKKKRKP